MNKLANCNASGDPVSSLDYIRPRPPHLSNNRTRRCVGYEQLGYDLLLARGNTAIALYCVRGCGARRSGASAAEHARRLRDEAIVQFDI